MTPDPQLAPAVLMIRPVAFFANPETMASNAFQRPDDLDPAALQARAAAESDGLAAALRAAGVAVYTFDDTPQPATPDAIFPNNWVSFHPDGTAVLYPMLAPNRRLERRPDVLASLREVHGFALGEVVDYSPHEADGRFLEGTGSLVLDRARRVAYACRSPRTSERVLADWSARLGYRVVYFDALGPDGTPIYHTNVLMSVGEGFAVLAEHAIPDPTQRAAVRARLERDGHEVVAIDAGQLAAFAGNMLALAGAEGQVLALSAQAEASLRPDQRAALARHARLVVADVSTIEAHAGGSVRCMLAEIFLPRA